MVILYLEYFMKFLMVQAKINFLYVFTGFAFPLNDTVGVASSFQWFSSGGDRGSRTLFAGERGGSRNAPAAKPLK
jgi:hypothetical protein